MTAYGDLYQFFAAYFHEDWTMEAPSADDVVSTFIGQVKEASELVRLADQIDVYLAASSDDEGLHKSLFADLGCYYDPSADGLSSRAWLLHVCRVLRAAAANRR